MQKTECTQNWWDCGLLLFVRPCIVSVMSDFQAAVVLHREQWEKNGASQQHKRSTRFKKSADLDWRVNAAKPVWKVWTGWRLELADKHEALFLSQVPSREVLTLSLRCSCVFQQSPNASADFITAQNKCSLHCVLAWVTILTSQLMWKMTTAKVTAV